MKNNKLKQNTLKILVTSMILTFILWNGLFAADISVIPDTSRVKQFETLYIQINSTVPFQNPYDPEDIRVDMIITTPKNEQINLPCFYKNGPPDKSQWEARYTPIQTGTHSYLIQVRKGQKTLNSKTFQVEVEESDHNGFLRLNPRSKYSFLFDSGKRFRGVGMNLGWEMQTEWKHPYETYLDELEKNHANYIRTWMCPWNLPLEWTKIVKYKTFTDEYENWGKTFSHSSGLTLDSVKTRFTADDINRVVIPSDSMTTIVYHIPDIKKFKIKFFYYKDISKDKIKCAYSEDNETYYPIDIEFSQTWNTYGDWYRIFVAYIDKLPVGANYLKIEFLEGLEGSPHLANIQIEHGQPTEILDIPGLGRYYRKTADRLDKIFRMADEKGIYIMLAIDYHGIFKSVIDRWASNAEWRTNPYNAANGGPCQTQTDFFTNPEARKIYKNKLRYLVARWGYSTQLGCWEFWNEIDNVMDWQDVPAEAITAWHEEMANYLKEIDPYQHLVSTSVSYREVTGLWHVKNIDFTQHHEYGSTEDMLQSILIYETSFNKPDVVGEFAVGWKGPGKDHPAELYEGEMHNGIWRGMFSPTPILPMTWWWEFHFHKNHYHHFKTAADFVSNMLKNNEDVIEEISVLSDNKNIEIMGLRSSNNLFVWLKNGSENILNILTLQIQDMIDANYILKTYDTWTGDYSEGEEIELTNGQLVLQDIQLKSEKDMAVWLRTVESDQ